MHQIDMYIQSIYILNMDIYVDANMIWNDRASEMTETICNPSWKCTKGRAWCTPQRAACQKSKGCFNHQQSDKSVLYDSALDVVLNHFLGIEYAFVLVETKNMNPVSISCCEKNYIYNVCTNFENRKQGNMEKLLNHFFDLVKKDKLKNGKHNEILLDVVFVNPDYQSVREYYENKYNFVFLRDESNKTILKKII